MAFKRLSMRKIHRVLRLFFEAGLSIRAIARSIQASPSTVGDYIRRAHTAGLSWPLPEKLDERALEARLFPIAQVSPRVERAIPDWVQVHAERRHKNVTLALLWHEYKAEHPEGLQYSQFCERYRAWRQRLDVVMRQTHRAGEKLFVDYAGQSVSVVERTTGELRKAQIFVAVLGASNYTFAEATWTQALPDWCASHVRALRFFHGVPELVIPDNLASAVRRRIADVVDEAQEMGDRGRDRKLAIEELGIEQRNRVRVAIADGALDEALEDTGEARNTARPRLLRTGKETSNTLEHREVGIVDGAAARLRRIAAVEGALDEAREVVLVETGQARADRCAPVRGQRARFNNSEVVVEHLRARLRNPLVAEGKDDGRSALGDGHHTGAHPHAGVAPACQRVAVVAERARRAAARADANLDECVEVLPNEHVDGVDKLLDRIDAELARDAHDGAVGVLDELHWGLLA